MTCFSCGSDGPPHGMVDCVNRLKIALRGADEANDRKDIELNVLRRKVKDMTIKIDAARRDLA